MRICEYWTLETFCQCGRDFLECECVIPAPCGECSECHAAHGEANCTYFLDGSVAPCLDCPACSRLGYAPVRE